MNAFILRAQPALSASALLAAAMLCSVVPTAQARFDTDTVTANSPSGFEAGRSGFVLTIDGELEVEYSVFALFLRPGETVELYSSEAARLVVDEPGEFDDYHLRLSLTAPPQPGLSSVVIETRSGARKTLNLVTMHQAEGERVGGYLLGAYPEELYRGEEVYRAPEFFAELTEEARALQVSPHFTLGQFVCKQEGDVTPHLIVTERLVVKLERVLEAANERGWRADTFHVMSGYRTPAYNAGLGNGRYSRHIYGGAADVFIDHDGDGQMDDLNGDGRIDRADAGALFNLVEELAGEEDFAPYLGGLGEYGATSWRPPFVHIDERGWRARWGRAAGS